MKKILSTTLLSLLCASIGLAGGWFVGMGKSQSFESEKHNDHTDHNVVPSLSEKALKNMGIVVREVNLTSFSKYESIPAIVEELPSTEQPIFAPISGRISRIFIREQQMVSQKQTLFSLVRSKLPRAELNLTQDILQSATKEFHESFIEFRRIIKSIEILEKERSRLQQYSNSKNNKYPLIPKKKLIEIQYEIDRAKNEENIIIENLLRHGISRQQIESGKSGEFPHFNVKVWKQALEHHGLWNSLAENLYSMLPKKLQSIHWTMATTGELVASGFIHKNLIRWFDKNPAATKHFLEIGGLLQHGYTLDKIDYLYKHNIFVNQVKIITPKFAKDWDVYKVLVKKQQLVSEGERLAILKNNRQMYLVIKPQGSERITILDAVEKKLTLVGHPLLEGEGPKLDNLIIDNATSDPQTGLMSAYIRLQNKEHAIRRINKNTSTRTWKIRAKQKYVIRVPTKVFEKVYVFPKDALAENGNKKVVFLQNGDVFKPLEVEVLYQDHEVVVVSNNADIFPGDPIVHYGAFALELAIKSAEGTDENAGHGHAH
ncbi:hypothetical protein [Candidatus Uabimicrobium sp. HlEnr_7]|uniref:hypothetical protein n=1 Tax=Candidatus Uabimicrobium helgolandensis TaxID=3095367 RepID=UPI0035575975